MTDLHQEKTEPEEKSVTLRKRKMPKSKTLTLIIISLIILVGAAVGGYFLWKHSQRPVKLSLVESTNAMSSRVDDAEVKNRFARAEPIMLHFTYTEADPGAVVRFEVKRSDGTIAKSGATTPLCASEGCTPGGERHISIVNTGDTVLDAGKYVVTLYSGEYTLKTIHFEIV